MLDWERIRRRPPPRRVRAALLMLAPHAVAAVLVPGLVLGGPLFPGGVMPPRAIGYAIIGAYYIGGPVCTVRGVRVLMGTGDRLASAILGVIVFAAGLLVMAGALFALDPR